MLDARVLMRWCATRAGFSARAGRTPTASNPRLAAYPAGAPTRARIAFSRSMFGLSGPFAAPSSL